MSISIHVGRFVGPKNQRSSDGNDEQRSAKVLKMARLETIRSSKPNVKHPNDFYDFVCLLAQSNPGAKFIIKHVKYEDTLHVVYTYTLTRDNKVGICMPKMMIDYIDSNNIPFQYFDTDLNFDNLRKWVNENVPGKSTAIDAIITFMDQNRPTVSDFDAMQPEADLDFYVQYDVDDVIRIGPTVESPKPQAASAESVLPIDGAPQSAAAGLASTTILEFDEWVKSEVKKHNLQTGSFVAIQKLPKIRKHDVLFTYDEKVSQQWTVVSIRKWNVPPHYIKEYFEKTYADAIKFYMNLPNDEPENGDDESSTIKPGLNLEFIIFLRDKDSAYFETNRRNMESAKVRAATNNARFTREMAINILMKADAA